MNKWTNGPVTLRLCDEEDWEILYDSLQDVQGRYWLQTCVEPLRSESSAETAWAEVLADEPETRMDFVILVKEEIVGVISLSVQDPISGTFTAPLFLLPKYRRKGYARHAMELLLNFAFNERRLHKWQASIVEDNLPSISLHERFGCVQEGRFRSQVYHEGTWHDVLWYGLTEEEYRRR